MRRAIVPALLAMIAVTAMPADACPPGLAKKGAVPGDWVRVSDQ